MAAGFALGSTLTTILALSAAAGHRIVVWVLAVLALTFGDRLIVKAAELWLVLASALLIVPALRALGPTLASSGGQGCDHYHLHPQDHRRCCRRN